MGGYRPANPSNELIIAEKRFKMPFPLVNFTEAPFMSSYVQGCAPPGMFSCGPGGIPREPAAGAGLDRQRPRRYGEAKNRTLAWAQSYVRQFVVHLDGLFDALQCFDVLQNERGLSVHFILDNDGVWYQTLDLIDCGYHANGMNETSVGVEICNRGEASGKNADFNVRQYEAMAAADPKLKREIVKCTIHGEPYYAFDFTKPQYEAMSAMAKELSRLMPNIKLDYPKAKDGGPSYTLIYPDDPKNLRLRESYSGYLGHYHCNIQKWDPGPYDFRKLIGGLAGRNVFPIGLHKLMSGNKVSLPEIPDKDDKLAEVLQAYYDNNEQEGSGGFYPVGPWEPGYRLFHGGVHLHPQEGDPVYAPFAGQVVAARQGPPSATIGSTNFVLLRHSVQLGTSKVEFFSLYMHVAEEKLGKKAQRLKWMASDGWKGDPGRVVVLKPPATVAAGEVIGHVGTAGPENEAELHFEIFATAPTIHEEVDKDTHYWHYVPSPTDRRFWKAKEIVEAIDKNRNKMFDHDELFTYFREDPGRITMHNVVTYRITEWSDSPSWRDELKEAGEFNKLKPAEIDELVTNQVEPMLWWTPELAVSLQLPEEGRVYTYHPITFIGWLNKLLGATKGPVVSATEKSSAAEARNYIHKGKAAMTDNEDKLGASMIQDDDIHEPPKLELENLIEGYGD